MTMFAQIWTSCALAAMLVAASPLARADESSVKGLLSTKYKALPANIGVKRLGVGGLYEVNLLGQEAYTNEKVEFLLIGGSLIDAATLTDLTVQRRPQFLREFFATLPLDAAIKTVYGKGERKLVAFEDPDCPLCKEQHTEWAKKPDSLNATVYTFFFPLNIHPDARRKSEFIWCQADPAAAWSAWMGRSAGLPLEKDGRLASAAPASCKLGVEKVAQSEGVARALGYHQTPRFIFANGWGASGVLSIEQFAEAFNKAAEPVPAPLPMVPKKELETKGVEKKK